MSIKSAWAIRPITVLFKSPATPNGDFTLVYSGKTIEQVKQAMMVIRDNQGILGYSYSQFMGRTTEVQFVCVDQPLLRLMSTLKQGGENFGDRHHVHPEEGTAIYLSKETFIDKYIAHCEFDTRVTDCPTPSGTQLALAEIAYKEYITDKAKFKTENPIFNEFKDYPNGNS
jgi:hypothetical protein